MEILTDSVSKAADFFGRTPAEAAESLRGLTPEERRLAEIFFKDRTAAMIRLEGAAFPPRFSLLILQESAARSNLDLMTDLQRRKVDLPDCLFCAALEGEGFLGRFDRSWLCLSGNIHAVFPLKPRLTLDQTGAAFSILGAIACVDAISALRELGADLSDDRNAPRIKWVNDVYIGERKIAGMLTRQSFQDPHITDVCLGIGVNVLHDPGLHGDPYVPATGCLKEFYADMAWTPGLFLAELALAIDSWYGRLVDEGPAPLMHFYRENGNFLGREVRIYEDGFGFGESGLGGRRLLARGVAEDVCEDLSITIAGANQTVSRGRLAFEKDCK